MADDFMDLLSGDGSGNQGKNEKGMEDLLGGLLGGGGGGDSAGGLGDLLGGLMGGGTAADAPGADMGDMAGMLGGLMGGGGAAAGGLGGLLGGLLGGGGDAGQMSFGGGSSGMSLPFAGTLAEKLGISEQMANMLIMGAIGLLTSSMAKNRSGGGELDYNSLADPDFIRSSGVAGRLSDQMGISEDDAIIGLQQTMGMMVAGGQTPAKPKKAAKKTTVKKTTATAKKPAAPKKTSAKTTKTTPKKKSTKNESGSDFMDLLDDITR